MKLTAERLAKLDEKISVFSCMKKIDDEVVIKMSKDLFCELIAINHPLVIFSTDDFHPHKYKGCTLELVQNPNYVAVAYYNIITGKEHHIREIEEE
jgi:hypothetical protein